MTITIFLVLRAGNELNEEIETAKKENPYNEKTTYFVYFTGIGCPHCANVDPLLLKHKVANTNIMVIEYEIYKDRANAPLLMEYHQEYNSRLGVPLLIAGKETSVYGDEGILENINKIIDEKQGNNILLPKSTTTFKFLDLNDLPGNPKIWYQNRVAVRKEPSPASDKIKEFLLTGQVPADAVRYKNPPEPVELSNDEVIFKNATEYQGWVLMWNSEKNQE